MIGFSEALYYAECEGYISDHAAALDNVVRKIIRETVYGEVVEIPRGLDRKDANYLKRQLELNHRVVRRERPF